MYAENCTYGLLRLTYGDKYYIAGNGIIREKSDYHNKSRSQIQQIPFRNGESSSAGGYRSNAADQQKNQTIPQARAPVVPPPNSFSHLHQDNYQI